MTLIPPNISVCIATYNGAIYIEEQLKSVLSQLADNDEVVISDDGSTDRTVQKVVSLNDARIRWAGLTGGLGVVRNFERALGEAKGRYIFLCDQDDVWLPSKVYDCLDALQKHLLVVTDCTLVDKDLIEMHHSFFELRHSGKGVVKNIWKNTYLGCCMAFRRELFDIALPIPHKMPMHDMWLGLIADSIDSVIFLPKRLSLYRRHQSAVSLTGSKSNFSLLKMLYLRLILSVNLLVRVTSFRIKYFCKKLK